MGPLYGPPAPCFFCEIAPPTQEHPFPHWMRRSHLKAGKEDLMETRVWTTTGTDGTEKRRALTKQFYGPCATCNNGWMSVLENSCKATLITLIDGKPCALDDPALRTILAAWCLKTIMMVHRSYMDESAMAIDRDLIPDAHLHELYQLKTRPPDCVVIWLATSEMAKGDIGGTLTGDQFGHYRITPLRLKHGLPVHSAIPGDDGYLASLRLGHLVIQVLGVDSPGTSICVPPPSDPFSLIPQLLWPLRDAISWPPGRGLASVQFPAFARRFTIPRINFAVPEVQPSSSIFVVRSFEPLQ